MAIYSLQTLLGPKEVIRKALDYFTGELGLRIMDQSPCCVAFVGHGGYILLTVHNAAEKSLVRLYTREWELQAKRFKKRLTNPLAT